MKSGSRRAYFNCLPVALHPELDRACKQAVRQITGTAIQTLAEHGTPPNIVVRPSKNGGFALCSRLSCLFILPYNVHSLAKFSREALLWQVLA